MPVRGSPALAATVNCTAELPVPAPGEALIHGTFVRALQLHPSSELRLTETDAPGDSMLTVDGVTS